MGNDTAAAIKLQPRVAHIEYIPYGITRPRIDRITCAKLSAWCFIGSLVCLGWLVLG
jgi:hypothetical protein